MQESSRPGTGEQQSAYDYMFNMWAFNTTGDHKSMFFCQNACCHISAPGEYNGKIEFNELDVCLACPVKQKHSKLNEFHTLAQEGTKHVLLKYVGHIMDLPVSVLLDCGASDNFISMSYAKRLNLKLVPVPQSSAQLANGSRIHIRYVVRQVLLNVGDYSVIQDYKVMEMKGLGVVLGKPWFNHADPNIDWRTNTTHIRSYGRRRVTFR